jgi:hypothetical protein
MSKQRIQVLLNPDTLGKVKAEAKEKSISESAVIRQKVEAMYKCQEEWVIELNGSDFKQAVKREINKKNPEFGTGKN